MSTHQYFKHTYAKYVQQANKAIEELQQDPSLTVVRLEPEDAMTFGTNKEDLTVLIRFQAMDGPLSRIPLFVLVYFPWDTLDMNQCYPECPPTFWLMNTTGRYNADVYRGYNGNRQSNHSSMCLSMLRPKSDRTSDWKAYFHRESNGWIVPSMDTVFASIQSMLCTYMVDQDYGSPKGEAVTMEAMLSAINSSQHYQKQYKRFFPQDCCDMLVIPTPVPAQQVPFNRDTFVSTGVNNHQLFSSNPFSLADKTWTFELDVEQVRNYPETVVSIMLVKASDSVDKSTRNGMNSESILRTGVTGQGMINGRGITKGKSIWSYHGSPWQRMKTVQVTLHDHPDSKQVEFTIVGQDQYGTKFVSGNSTMKMVPHESSLYQSPVKLVIYTNNKRTGGRQSVQLKALNPPQPLGYIQPQTYNTPAKFDKGVCIQDPRPDIDQASSSAVVAGSSSSAVVTGSSSSVAGSSSSAVAGSSKSDVESISRDLQDLTIKPPIYVGLMFSKQDTVALHQRVLGILGEKCPHYKRSILPGHVTLLYLGGNPHSKMTDFYESVKPHVGKEYTVTIEEIYADKHGLCVTVSGQIPHHPNQKLHMTLKLNNKPPMYSNQMITSPKAATMIVDAKDLDLTMSGVIGEYRP